MPAVQKVSTSQELIDNNLQGQKISDTYNKVIQISNGKLFNGVGELVLDLNTQGDATYQIPAGTTTFLSVDRLITRGVFVDYVLYNNFGQRSGRFIVNNFNGQLEFTEACTNDLGSDTSSVNFDAVIDGFDIDLNVTAPNSSYTLNIHYKYI